MRCPECGGKFDWLDLTDPTRKLHPYLFEHHPERNLKSFIRTVIGGIFPRRFWQTLHPAQPSRPRRLLLYWFVVSFLCLLVPAAIFVQLRDRSARGNVVEPGVSGGASGDHPAAKRFSGTDCRRSGTLAV